MKPRAIAFAFVFAVAACGGNGNANDITCPTTGAPTYATFGQSFFSTYCTPCHSATSSNRNNAPDGLNFDTEAEIRENADDIDMMAGWGDDGPNTTMPYMPGPVTMEPTTDQRKTLAELLACEEGSAGASN